MTKSQQLVQQCINVVSAKFEYFRLEYSASYAGVIGILTSVAMTIPLVYPPGLSPGVSIQDETLLRIYNELRNIIRTFAAQGAEPLEVAGALLLLAHEYSEQARNHGEGDEWQK